MRHGATDQRTRRTITAIAPVALAVSAAKLAWDPYQGLKAQNATPASEPRARRLPLELAAEAYISDSERHRVIRWLSTRLRGRARTASARWCGADEGDAADRQELRRHQPHLPATEE